MQRSSIRTQTTCIAMRAASLLLGILCAVSVFALALRGHDAPEAEADTRTSQTVDAEIRDCEALLSRLKSEQNELSAQLASLQGQTNVSEEQALLAAGQIALLDAEIELNQALLESCDMKRGTVQTELQLVENEYEYYQDLFAELMRFVYENGTVTDFELLFSSASLSDYLDRRDHFNSIMECVSDLTQSIEQSVLRLSDLEEEYTLAEEQYKRYLETLNADKQQLERAKAEFQALAQELHLDFDRLSDTYTQLSNTIADAKTKLSSLQDERADLRRQEEEAKRQEQLGHLNLASGFAWPLEAGISYRITSYFSTRTNPITGVGYEFHQGLDIACGKGTKIIAAKAGIVTKSAWYGGYGNCVIVYHGKDTKGRVVTTLYGHASALKCKEGDQVNQGDLLALVGTTGRSTGNHLHFSVLLDGVYVDPDDYLPDGFYKKMPNS